MILRRRPMDYSEVICRGLLKRCPRCGESKLFHHWFTMALRCPTCAYYFERDSGYWSGAVALNGVTTTALFLAIVAAVLSFTWPYVPTFPLLIVAVVFTTAFSLFFFPFSKTIWAAIDFALHPLEPDEVEESSELVHLREQMLVKHGDADQRARD
jgi:uncharacterized protein (DUF983 family)